MNINYYTTPLMSVITTTTDKSEECNSDLKKEDVRELNQAIFDVDDNSTCTNSEYVSTSIIDRLRHGTGHTHHDMCIIRTFFQQNNSKPFRIPDAVIYPKTKEQIIKLIHLSVKKQFCLIPFGGGTNVSHALHCPSKDVEPRCILSVDMKYMNRIISINEEDRVVHVEAGINGKTLLDELSKRGYTIGHYPDSYEFSTLGGWIATKSSGMKQAKYGNIEDIVQSAQVVLGREDVDTHSNTYCYGRQSLGPSLNLSSLMIGSEGCLGIITSAVLKIWKMPQCVMYDSILLPTFDDGLNFMKEISKMSQFKPASVRLIDNVQFRLGQAMNGYNDDSDDTQSLYDDIKQSIQSAKHFLIKTGTHLFMNSAMMNYNNIVCVSIVFEGTYVETKTQKDIIKNIIQTKNIYGIFTGSSVGKKAYELTFAIGK